MRNQLPAASAKALMLIAAMNEIMNPVLFAKINIRTDRKRKLEYRMMNNTTRSLKHASTADAVTAPNAFSLIRRMTRVMPLRKIRETVNEPSADVFPVEKTEKILPLKSEMNTDSRNRRRNTHELPLKA